MGFTLHAILWYLVVTETSTHTADGGNLVQRIGEEVKSGDLARVLIRPYSYVAYQFAVFWGELALRLPVQATLAAAVVWVAIGPPPTSGAAALIALLSVALSLTINFLACTGIGLLAFWFEESLPFYWVYQKLVFTIGGLFIPLELLPEWLAGIAARLPFASVAYTPGRLFLGAAPDSILQALSLQVFWVAALACAVSLLYASGIRKLSIHGG